MCDRDPMTQHWVHHVFILGSDDLSANTKRSSNVDTMLAIVKTQSTYQVTTHINHVDPMLAWHWYNVYDVDPALCQQLLTLKSSVWPWPNDTTIFTPNRQHEQVTSVHRALGIKWRQSTGLWESSDVSPQGSGNQVTSVHWALGIKWRQSTGFWESSDVSPQGSGNQVTSVHRALGIKWRQSTGLWESSDVSPQGSGNQVTSVHRGLGIKWRQSTGVWESSDVSSQGSGNRVTSVHRALGIKWRQSQGLWE